MNIKVAIKKRLKHDPKVEISSDKGKLFTVIDDHTARAVNRPPNSKKFAVDMIADQILTNDEMFKCEYASLEKFPLYLAPGFAEAVNDIAVKAAKKGLEFKPFSKMLRALYRDTERLALYLKRLDKDADIDQILQYKELFKVEDDKKKTALKPEARICAELLGVKDFYKQFNEIAAKHYRKEKHSVLRKSIEGYAAGHHEPSNWVCAVALEVMSKSGINVLDLGLDNETIMTVWSKSNPDRKDKASEVLGVLNLNT